MNRIIPILHSGWGAKNDLKGVWKSIKLAANLPTKTNTQPIVDEQVINAETICSDLSTMSKPFLKSFVTRTLIRRIYFTN